MITLKEFEEAGGDAGVRIPICDKCNVKYYIANFDWSVTHKEMYGVWYHCRTCGEHKYIDIRYVMGFEVKKRTIRGWKTKR